MSTSDENEYTRDGVRYVAEPVATAVCARCAFENNSIACEEAPSCVKREGVRSNTIIWVVAK